MIDNVRNRFSRHLVVLMFPTLAFYACNSFGGVCLATSATWYVSQEGSSSASGKSWSDPISSIQIAIDRASSGDNILVTNGIYTSFVITNKILTVKSVTGATGTIIDGGNSSVCADFGCSTESALIGFTLQNGRAAQYGYGAGASYGSLSNCIIRNCIGYYGGGAGRSILNSCLLFNNSAEYGGGANDCVLNRCEIRNNHAKNGGGISGSVNSSDGIDIADNCLIVGNSSEMFGGGAFNARLNNCTIIGNSMPKGWSYGGTSIGGGGGAHSCRITNCIIVNNTSRYGQSNVDGVSEYYTCEYTCTTPAVGGVGNISADPRFVNVDGENYRLKADSPCINAGYNAYSSSMKDISGYERNVCGFVDMGAHEYQGSEVVWHVDAISGNDANTGADWECALKTIQRGIDLSSDAEVLFVKPGTYGSIVTADKKIIIKSVEGPESTIITGSNSSRCVTFGSTTNTVLIGFTLMNGRADNGGGAYGGTLKQCIIKKCRANLNGGAAYASCMIECVVKDNYSAGQSGGTEQCIMTDCLITNNSVASNGVTGGSSRGRALRCRIVDNSAGGSYADSLIDCLIVGNSSYGAMQSTLVNCTVTCNLGKGTYYGTAKNSIIYGNQSGQDVVETMCEYSCVGNEVVGIGNMVDDPLFVDIGAREFALCETSPCVDTGNNGYVQSMQDFMGGIRISGGRVDMGCMEFLQKPIEAKVTGYVGAYDGQSHGISISVTAPIQGSVTTYAATEDGTYSAEPITIKDIGSTTIWYKVSAKAYLPISGKATVSITPKQIENFMVYEVANQTYTGAEIRPAIIWNEGSTSVDTNNYIIQYANNINVGVAEVKVIGMRNYAGEIIRNFTICKATNEWVKAPFISSWVVGQTPSEPDMGDAKFGAATVAYSGVGGALGTTRPTEPGEYVAVFAVAETANWTGLSKEVPFKITTAEEAKLEDAFEGLPATIEPDGEGGWTVTITNDIDVADLPIEIPDNIGDVTIDLNGHDLIGGDGRDGARPSQDAGEDGKPAIVIVPGEGDGAPTVITIVNSGEDAIVQGGEGGSGNPAGNGAPAIEVDDGAQDGVLINIGEGVTVQGGDDYTPAIVGEVGVNEGTIIGPSRIHIPGEGTVTVPKSWKVGQKVTWKATAAKGSVFARWEGAFVDLLNLTKNERRNPSLALVVPVGFDTNGISAVFISVDDDRLGTLALSQPGPFAPNADVAGLSLVDDSESYVTASVSGLPTGLKFDAKTLAISGKPTKPGVYTVKVTAKNASGYQWAENIALRVADIENARIDFGGLPETGAVGEPFAGRIAAGEFKSLSASGLPAGLKLDAKSGAVAGIPTKGGWFTVTVTATYADKSKATATRLLTISPMAAVPEPKRTAYHPLTVICATEGGTVSGTGVYAEGKKAAIKATAAKGYVFAGWYEDSRLTTPATFATGDFRTASQNVVVPEMRYVFARFVTVDEDKGSISAGMNGVGLRLAEDGSPYQTNVMCGVALRWPIAVEALSLPTVAVAGLPTGLKFTAKDVVDSKTKQVTVPANTIYGTPTAASKVDAKTGAVKPSVVKVTVTTASKAKVVYEIDVTVDAVKEWAVGTFDGYVRGSGTLAASPKGLATVTVSAAGKISGKLLEGDKTWTLSAANFDAYDAEAGIYTATVVGKSGKEVVTNEVTVAAEEMRLGEDASPHLVGVVSGATVGRAVPGEPYSWTAWQNLWKTEPWKTDAKPFAKAPALTLSGTADGLPTDGDMVTLKFASSGAVTASGKFVTGQDAKGKDVVYSASCSSVLVPEADAAGAGRPPYRIFLYFPPKAGKFEGYADEVSLEWDGAAFEAVRP